jgi:MFS transporter
LVWTVRTTARGTVRTTRWLARNVGIARQQGGVGNLGMIRLLDLHAISCAGDTLVTVGLAGTIFFAVPAEAARSRVGLYLFFTMAPLALLAPVVGPVLDRFRHGRRYALATTMLGRAALAWVIADNVGGIGLYPAAFGVLALSRTYGLARSAAVPRLLPRGLGLSQAGARASAFGTVAGLAVAPIGALAFRIGPQWPLRVASLIFLVGVLVAVNLPSRADGDPPEVVPKLFQLPWRHRRSNGDTILSGRLLVAALIGSAGLRVLTGFLLVFLAFAIRAGHLPTDLLGVHLPQTAALGVIAAALALGAFLASAIGSWMLVRRPMTIQAVGLAVVAPLAMVAAAKLTLGAASLLCLATAIANGLAKLSVDAVIQERTPDTVRASAFAHAETLLMLAWVAGGAAGLLPLGGRFGLIVVAGATLLATGRAVLVASRLRQDRLLGRAAQLLDRAAQLLDRSPAGVPGPLATAAPALPAAVDHAPTGTPGPSAAVELVPALGAAAQPEPGQTTTDAAQAPGFHVFRPTPPDSGVSDPREGG